MISSLNRKQHVQQTTHKDGHILDLIITRSEEDIINSVLISDPGISDHYAVNAKLRHEKPIHPRKEVFYRKLKSINYQDFCTDLERFYLISDFDTPSFLNEVVKSYSKMSFYSDLIDNLKSDQRNLFCTVDKMLHKKAVKHYPSCESFDKLGNYFVNYFTNKITNISTSISIQASANQTEPNYDTLNPCKSEFVSFSPVTSEQLDKMSCKSCDLDPVPAFVFKKCSHVLVPVITKAVNLPLEHAVMPPSLKLHFYRR